MFIRLEESLLDSNNDSHSFNLGLIFQFSRVKIAFDEKSLGFDQQYRFILSNVL